MQLRQNSFLPTHSEYIEPLQLRQNSFLPTHSAASFLPKSFLPNSFRTFLQNPCSFVRTHSFRLIQRLTMAEAELILKDLNEENGLQHILATRLSQKLSNLLTMDTLKIQKVVRGRERPNLSKEKHLDFKCSTYIQKFIRQKAEVFNSSGAKFEVPFTAVNKRGICRLHFDNEFWSSENFTPKSKFSIWFLQPYGNAIRNARFILAKDFAEPVKIKRKQCLVRKEIGPVISLDDMKNAPTAEAVHFVERSEKWLLFWTLMFFTTHAPEMDQIFVPRLLRWVGNSYFPTCGIPFHCCFRGTPTFWASISYSKVLNKEDLVVALLFVKMIKTMEI
ncbi:hypothetical protein K1719_019049 [Acacia pycnantha]|nr:hypothetical protein K1719_019049 [Acacia pycnantha]